MEPLIKRSPNSWDVLQHALEDRLALLRKDEPNTLKMAAKAAQLCTDMLQQLQGQLTDYRFYPGEEILFYKEIKPFFLARLFYHHRLYDFEIRRLAVGSHSTDKLMQQTLDDITAIFERHGFIHRYLKSGATYLDDKLFFHPTSESATALMGLDFPSDTSFPVCYDYVVSHLQAADMLRTYIEDTLEEGRQSNIHASGLPRVTWTDSKTALIELAYALHAAGVFNNGKVDLKDIMEFMQATFHIDLGNYPRTFQEILSRKSGYTNALDRYRDKLLLRIQKIEEKYDR
jgi:hypothetical protein